MRVLPELICPSQPLYATVTGEQFRLQRCKQIERIPTIKSRSVIILILACKRWQPCHPVLRAHQNAKHILSLYELA